MGAFTYERGTLYTSKVGNAAVLHYFLHALEIRRRVLELPRGHWFISKIGSINSATYRFWTITHAWSEALHLPQQTVL